MEQLEIPNRLPQPPAELLAAATKKEESTARPEISLDILGQMAKGTFSLVQEEEEED